MKKRILDLFVVYLAVVSLLLQTISPIFNLTTVANAQETEQVTSSEPTPAVENTTPESTSTQVTETPEESPSPEIQTTPASTPTENFTPVPTNTESLITPVVSQAETASTPIPNENSPPAEDNSNSPSSASLTPETDTKDPTGNEDINMVILENVSAPSIDLGVIEPENSATLTTDKGDYAPTDTALITGTGLNTNTDYNLRIWSDNAPAKSSEVKITSDGDGTFVYAYQLDGTYRPNYSAELKDSNGTIVASVTFTDSSVQTEVRACMQDNPSSAKDLVCTANDVSVASVSDIQILDDGCSAPGDTVTFTATWDLQSTSSERYDIGLYFATQGQSSALNGTCSVSTLANSPTPPWSNLDGDACGDITSAAQVHPVITMTATCNPDPTTGLLKLPYCTSWDNNSTDVCTTPADAYPSTKSKCNCKDGFTVPIPVPPAIEVIKNLSPSNDTGKFDLQVNNVTKKIDAVHNDTTGKVGITTGQNTFGELGGTGTDLSSYSSNASCVLRGTQTPVTSVQNGNTWTIANVTNGQDIVCTITNTKLSGTITVNKSLSPSDDPGKFNLQIDGSTAGTGVNVGNNGTTGSITVSTTGQHTVSETAGTDTSLSDYTTTYSCDNDLSGSGTTIPAFSVTANQDVVCTFTNTRNTGSIQVNKLLDNDGNGIFETLNPASFNWSLDGSGTNAMGSKVNNVNTGNHSINENSVENYHLVGWYTTGNTAGYSCSNPEETSLPASINVTKDSTSSITICNARDTGTVVVHKDVQGPDGAALSDITTDFTVDLDGSNSQSLTDDGTYTYTNVPTGSHTVHETNVSSDYDLYGISLTTGTAGNTGGLTFDVTKNQTTHVYVTNRQKLAHITVEKVVLNASGKEVTDHQTFSVQLNGANTVNTLADNNNVVYDVNPGGPYAITEIPNGNYDYLGCKLLSGAEASQFSPKSNESITVTCTNQQKPGSITGYKFQSNGITPIANWGISLFSCDSNFTTCSANAILTTLTNASGFYSFTNLIVGFYKVVEDLVNTYTPVGVTFHNVTINPATESTNNNFSNFKNVSITACKKIDADGSLNTSDDQTNKSGWTVNLLTDGEVTNTQLTGDDGCYTWTNLGPDHTYEVSENVPAGWIALTPTQSLFGPVRDGVNNSYTFVNTQLGTMIVKKVMVGGEDDFPFTGDVSGTISTNNGILTINNVFPGSYSSVEGTKAVWDLNSIICDDTTNGGTASTGNIETRTATFNVEAGETVTCTFTNTQKGRIIVDKITYPSGSNQIFNFDTTGLGYIDFSLTDEESPNYQEVVPGTYSVSENAVAEWNSNGGACDKDETPASLDVAPGETVTCTFTNYKPSAQIDLTPLRATNKIGDNHVVTANVQVQNGNGTWGPTADGTLVTFSLNNSNGATATFVNGVNTCTTTSGTCSVTINSPTSGNVSISAFSSPIVLGVTVTATTGTGGENSSDAQKDYVNARISITPESATNEVGDDHNFTVKVEKSTDEGVWTNAVGAIVNAIVTPSTSINVSDCNAGTDANGECTVTVNSNSAGAFSIIARSTIDVNGVEFKLQTNGLDENSDPAIKTFVDASIALSPQEATNNVNDPHTITAHVTKNDGTGVSSASGVTVVFTVTSGTATFVGNDNDCVTNASGECSVQIVDSEPGANTIDATTTFSVGGISLTRATNGNSGPDGTNSAEKTYVAGRIIVEKQTLPDDTNQSFEFNPSWSETNFSISDGEQNDSGYLSPGTHSVEELTPNGWDLTSAVCSDQSPIDEISLQANETVTCTFTNTQRGKVIVTKYNSDTEKVLSDWTINLTNSNELITKSDVTGLNGQAIFDNLIPYQNYLVDETLKDGWEQTYISCGSEREQVFRAFDLQSEDKGTYAYVYPGETTYCEIYNRNIVPVLNISKLNNATTVKAVGDSVEYTIIVTLDEEGGPAQNVEVTDLPPDGFTYKSSSWKAYLNGNPISIPEPVYASPGEWQIGDMNPGDEVVLKYDAVIQSDVTNGKYYDIALALGNPISDTKTDIYAIAVNPGDIDPGTESNFVGTDVTVTSSSTQSTSYEATQTQEILGASTILPATGTPTQLIVIGFLTLLVGAVSLTTGLALRRKYE